jgi:hypothetical protein
MKTNQILTRKMGDFNVNQRTSDGMFNSNSLLIQWNDNAQGIKRKKMSEFLESPKTKEFIKAILEEEKQSRNIDLSENQVFTKGRVKTLSNGEKIPSDVWMHPFLFINFAMWLNPKFKVKVIKFVYDELIKNRHDAGDNYRILSQSVSKIVDKAFLPVAIQNVAKAINYVVFNQHISGIRNTEATEETLRELSSLELKLSELINDGFIKTYDELLSYLRKQWNNKYQPKLLKQSA